MEGLLGARHWANWPNMLLTFLGDIQVDVWVWTSERRPGPGINIDMMEYYAGIKNAVHTE